MRVCSSLLLLALLPLTQALVQPHTVQVPNAARRWSPRLFAAQDPDEDARLRVLATRRRLIRGVLRSAESLRRLRSGGAAAPPADSASNTKMAVSLTAFLVAAGAVTLRVGGRAALVSALGLDFAQDNPQLKDTLDQVLLYSDSIDTYAKLALFIGAWTLVKVFCFDSGGIVLALSSGVLFGGVLQGATLSALAATIGSTVAFYLTQIPTPFRTKALQLLDENPTLRGIQKVVAQDGFKTILTLRLAPVLPIPLGMYNYIYGLTNVTLTDFTAGIFLGSFKPYLLDSYLGYFGKQIVDGEFITNKNPLSAASDDAINMQDFILLLALGASVLIGTFASQLANDTWESIQDEIQLQQEANKMDNHTASNHNDSIVQTIMGWKLPSWIVELQTAYHEAEQRVQDMIRTEYTAQVWNYTDTTTSPIPTHLNPAFFLNSPEITQAGQGFNWVSSLFDGVVLSPCLIGAFLQYSDPQFHESMQISPLQPDCNMTIPTISTATTITPPTANSTSTQAVVENYKTIVTILRNKVEQKLIHFNNT